jgi:hypothetical protein
MDYPKKRTVRWIDDDTGEEVGSCEYIRAELYNELLRAADKLADHVEAVAEWMRSNGYDDDADISALTAYKKAKETTND